MAYEEKLASRLRDLLADEEGISETKMFGGLGFLLNGNLTVSASGRGGLLVRVDPAEADTLIGKPGVGRMEMRGRTMKGWITVAPEALKTKRDLTPWVKRGLAFAKMLPAK